MATGEQTATGAEALEALDTPVSRFNLAEELASRGQGEAALGQYVGLVDVKSPPDIRLAAMQRARVLAPDPKSQLLLGAHLADLAARAPLHEQYVGHYRACADVQFANGRVDEAIAFLEQAAVRVLEEGGGSGDGGDGGDGDGEEKELTRNEFALLLRLHKMAYAARGGKGDVVVATSRVLQEMDVDVEKRRMVLTQCAQTLTAMGLHGESSAACNALVALARDTGDAAMVVEEEIFAAYRLRDAKKYDEAELRLVGVLATSPPPASVLAVRDALGIVYSNWGKYDKAILQLTIVADAVVAEHGREARPALEARGNLAQARYATALGSSAPSAPAEIDAAAAEFAEVYAGLAADGGIFDKAAVVYYKLATRALSHADPPAAAAFAAGAAAAADAQLADNLLHVAAYSAIKHEYTTALLMANPDEGQAEVMATLALLRANVGEYHTTTIDWHTVVIRLLDAAGAPPGAIVAHLAIVASAPAVVKSEHWVTVCRHLISVGSAFPAFAAADALELLRAIAATVASVLSAVANTNDAATVLDTIVPMYHALADAAAAGKDYAGASTFVARILDITSPAAIPASAVDSDALRRKLATYATLRKKFPDALPVPRVKIPDLVAALDHAHPVIAAALADPDAAASPSSSKPKSKPKGKGKGKGKGKPKGKKKKGRR